MSRTNYDVGLSPRLAYDRVTHTAPVPSLVSQSQNHFVETWQPEGWTRRSYVVIHTGL